MLELGGDEKGVVGGGGGGDRVVGGGGGGSGGDRVVGGGGGGSGQVHRCQHPKSKRHAIGRKIKKWKIPEIIFPYVSIFLSSNI